ncbi:MAG TPA: hypothetical protein VHW03_07930 [Chthoniobacterales bacterium]|nr:hypothetical protein [Chthoniobacterales bacterium]
MRAAANHLASTPTKEKRADVAIRAPGKLDNDDQTTIEVEEAFLQTTDLPFGLQLKGGQFFAAFGRINPTHPHTWDFVDDPLVHGEFLGPDGLRGIGAQVSWTVPVAWYSQFLFGVQNGRGDTGFRFAIPATTAPSSVA